LLLNVGAHIGSRKEIWNSKETRTVSAVFDRESTSNFSFAGFFCGLADYSRSWN
jgi:hypothetical protein